jgi:hypothetical protein
MGKPHKDEIGTAEENFTSIMQVFKSVNGKLREAGQESGVITCPLCKTGKLRYARSADHVHFDVLCTNPRCGLSWRL